MVADIRSFFEDWDPWILTHGFRILLIIIIAYGIWYFGKLFVERVVRLAVKQDARRTALDEKKREDTLIRVFALAVTYAIIGIAAVMILQEVGIPVEPILAGAGIFGIAVGFGSQYLIRDIINGFFLIMENQYRIGDFVRFESISGKVEDIKLRITTLRDVDGTIHYIPNGEIKKVSNYSKSLSNINMKIPVAYDADMDLVIRTINKVGKEMSLDPAWKDFILSPVQFKWVEEFTDATIHVRITGHAQPLKQWAVSGQYRKQIKEAFDKERIRMSSQVKYFRDLDDLNNPGE